MSYLLDDVLGGILGAAFPIAGVIGLAKKAEDLFGDDHSTIPINAGPPPQPTGMPQDKNGLQATVDELLRKYQQAGGAAAAADVKLTQILQQIVSSNETARSKIGGVLAELQTMREKVAHDPEVWKDPSAMKAFWAFVDSRLGQIQSALDQAQADGTKQAEQLRALSAEYHSTAGPGDQRPTKDAGPGDQHPAKDAKDPKATPPPADTTGSGQQPGVVAQPAAGPAAISDPLAGLPGGLGGMGGMDPMSMLGPALAGLGSIPGSLGGLASSLPQAAMGMAPLAGQMAGAGEGFKDEPATHDGAKPADFVDDHHSKDEKNGGDQGADEHTDSDKKGAAATPVAATTQAAAGAAVPATAGGDPTMVVTMPDGSPVTATSRMHETAMRAVLGGSSVTDGWKAANVALPPPGTPVTEPADPSHLPPGAVAQFKTREPVMYMGNDKIWLDGQLQPKSALPTSDFLGWVDPGKQAGAQPAPPAPVAAPKAPVT